MLGLRLLGLKKLLLGLCLIYGVGCTFRECIAQGVCLLA